jgi:hypothetical protein
LSLQRKNSAVSACSAVDFFFILGGRRDFYNFLCKNKNQINPKNFLLAEPAELKPLSSSPHPNPPPRGRGDSFWLRLCRAAFSAALRSGREKSLCLSQSQQGKNSIINIISRAYRERFL